MENRMVSGTWKLAHKSRSLAPLGLSRDVIENAKVVARVTCEITAGTANPAVGAVGMCTQIKGKYTIAWRQPNPPQN